MRSRSGTADADAGVGAGGACASDGGDADEGKDDTRARDSSAAAAAPPRGGSTAAPGILAAPHAASGPWTRGVVGKDEPFGYAGYAGVAGGGVVSPPPPFTNASSVSAMGSILFSDAGGGMPGLGGGAYVVCGAPEESAAATLGGMYANLESGLGLDGALLLATAPAPAPSAPVEARRASIERGERGIGPGMVKRLLPATRFGAGGLLSMMGDEIRGVVVGNGEGGSGSTSLSV